MKRRDEVLVGIFTTAAVGVAVLGALWLARGGLEAGYPLYSRFPWGAGLKQGQPVWLVGVTVGFVDKVDLDPTGTLVATYRIQDDYKVPKGTSATVVPNGFFGDVAIALTPSAPNPESYAEGDTIPVGKNATGIQALTARADTLTAGLNAIVGGARQQLVDSGGIAEMRRTIESANRLVVQLGQIATIQSRELQSTIATVRTRAAAIDSTQLDSTVRALRQTSQNMATVTSELKTTTDRINGLLAKVEQGNGTAGKLVSDPALYNDLRTLLASVDSLTKDLKANPKKYINLSIF